jgi:hypothetical protein
MLAHVRVVQQYLATTEHRLLCSFHGKRASIPNLPPCLPPTHTQPNSSRESWPRLRACLPSLLLTEGSCATHSQGGVAVSIIQTRLSNYQLTPSHSGAPVGQRHPQGANPGSDHRQSQLKTKPWQTWLPPAHPYPLPANVCQASPIQFAKG